MKCHEKIRFESFAAAETARLQHEQVYRVDKGELATYRCPRCGGFHNGHTQQPSSAASRAVAETRAKLSRLAREKQGLSGVTIGQALGLSR